MNFSCLLPLAVLRTPASPWDTLFPLGVGLVLDSSVFSLACALPSPASAEGFPSLFGRFIGTTAQSDSSGAYMSAVRLSAFSDRSRSDRDTPEVSRFSCMLFLDVLRFLRYAGPDAPSRSSADAHFAFPFRKQGRHPETDFSKLNSPARRCLCLHFERRLATPSAGLEVKVVRYSFLVGLFYSQQHAGLSRRSRGIRIACVKTPRVAV